jgi:hypothetical protein
VQVQHSPRVRRVAHAVLNLSAVFAVLFAAAASYQG